MPLTTKVVTSNPAHGYMYWIQHYVIKFVSNLRQVGGFFHVLFFNKTDCYDITEILFIVTLNTITLTLYITHRNVIIRLLRLEKKGLGLGVMMFNAIINTISVISWRSVLLVEETGVPGENHQPAASH